MSPEFPFSDFDYGRRECGAEPCGGQQDKLSCLQSSIGSRRHEIDKWI
jgi:hypothetical protein